MLRPAIADRLCLVYPLLADSHFDGEPEMGNWADDELAGANLGDARLNQRLVKLATRFVEQPTASISNACADLAETMAAYRFFDQASTDKRGLNWQSILQAHIDGSEARMMQHPVVNCGRRFLVKKLPSGRLNSASRLVGDSPNKPCASKYIARRRRFLARKSDGKPGVKSLWLDFQALRHLVSGVEIARRHGYAT